MISGLAILLLFQLAGELIVTATGLPIPGPVVGMLLLFIVLLARGRVPHGLERTADALIKTLSLLFVPAGTGVVAYLALLRQEWLPITAALIGGTALTIAATALTMRAVIAHRERKGPRSAA